MSVSDDFFEMDFVSQVLGARVEQIEHLCRVLGVAPSLRNGEVFLERDAVRVLYRALNPEFVPPEAA